MAVAVESKRRKQIKVRLDGNLEGGKIYLREIKLSDADNAYCRWLNDPEVNQYLESRFERWTVVKLKEYVRKAQEQPNQLLLAVVLKENDRHVGNIKIGPIHPVHRYADVGILIGEKSCWGKGIATEAIQLLVEYAFGQLGFHKLTAGAYSNNKGSIKAFEKAGFIVEGVRRQHAWCGNRFVDSVLMGRINEDFKEGRGR